MRDCQRLAVDRIPRRKATAAYVASTWRKEAAGRAAVHLVPPPIRPGLGGLTTEGYQTSPYCKGGGSMSSASKLVLRT
jgi:hypothetical protein